MGMAQFIKDAQGVPRVAVHIKDGTQRCDADQGGSMGCVSDWCGMNKGAGEVAQLGETYPNILVTFPVSFPNAL